MTARNFFLVLFLAGVLVLATSELAAAHGRDGGGAGARPQPPRPELRGGSNAPNGTSLAERRGRTRRLRELETPAATATPPRDPTPTGAGGRGGAEQPPVQAQDRSLVHLHHGSVRLAAGLARVDLTLEVQNAGPDVMEWDRVYAIDPAAEVIGAVLKRVSEDPIHARTLTTEDARRVYARIRTPPPERTPGGRNRDPLLVSRERNDRLRIQIWPINPQETVRVELTFVTPLRGHGPRRTYVDVMGGPAKRKKAPRVTRPERGEDRPRRPDSMVDHEADWLVQPGELILASAPADGMALRGEAGGLLRFQGKASTTAEEPAPRVAFLSKRRSTEALLAGSGSYAGRIATWRFDPRSYLTSKGFAFIDSLTVRLRAERGSCKRLAPESFGALDEARPVTALMTDRAAGEVRYRVEVLDRDGRVVVHFDETVPLMRGKLDAELEDAVTGYHRAQVARRVFRWAGSDTQRLREARRFAVDAGVLVPGSAAIAIPVAEKRRLTPALRRLYEMDGVPLGAPRHEADFKAPPKDSLER